MSDYIKYRGKCRELSEQAIKDDPTLTLVRGYYYCPIWGEQAHWWTMRQDGTIYDPTKDQFPSRGFGEYVEFDGYFRCEQCGESVHEDKAYRDGHHVFCSGTCYARCVGF